MTAQQEGLLDRLAEEHGIYLPFLDPASPRYGRFPSKADAAVLIDMVRNGQVPSKQYIDSLPEASHESIVRFSSNCATMQDVLKFWDCISIDSPVRVAECRWAANGADACTIEVGVGETQGCDAKHGWLDQGRCSDALESIRPHVARLRYEYLGQLSANRDL